MKILLQLIQIDLIGDEWGEWCRGIVAVVPVAMGDLQRGGLGGLRVLRVAVAAQVYLTLERLVTQTTRERLVSRVLAHVRDQV